MYRKVLCHETSVCSLYACANVKTLSLPCHREACLKHALRGHLFPGCSVDWLLSSVHNDCLPPERNKLLLPPLACFTPRFHGKRLLKEQNSNQKILLTNPVLPPRIAVETFSLVRIPILDSENCCSALFERFAFFTELLGVFHCCRGNRSFCQSYEFSPTETAVKQVCALPRASPLSDLTTTSYPQELTWVQTQYTNKNPIWAWKKDLTFMLNLNLERQKLRNVWDPSCHQHVQWLMPRHMGGVERENGSQSHLNLDIKSYLSLQDCSVI